MANLVRINFLDPAKKSRFSLDYEIIPSNFTNKWLVALQHDLRSGTPFRQGLFYGARFVQEEKLRNEMQACMDRINSWKKQWIDFRLYPNMSHSDLMKLHDTFEDLNPLMEAEGYPPAVKEALLSVNTLIHRYETMFRRKELFHVDVQFHHCLSWQFEEEDFSLFRSEEECGTLYLDYGVTGVPILNAFRENIAQRPVPQYNFKSNMKLCFRGTPQKPVCRETLGAWLKSKWQMDINDPKLAIGYIPLGKLTNAPPLDEIGRQLESHREIHSVEILEAESFLPVRLPIRDSFLKRHFYSFDSEEARADTTGLEDFWPGQGNRELNESLPIFQICLRSMEGDKTASLSYQLYDHAVSRRWLAFLSDHLAEFPRGNILSPELRTFGFGLEDTIRSGQNFQKQLAPLLRENGELFRDMLGVLGVESAELAGREEEVIEGWLREKKIYAEVLLPYLSQTVVILSDRGEGDSTTAKALRDCIDQLHLFLAKDFDPQAGHINLDFHRSPSAPLTEADSALFSIDHCPGEVYLSYGQKGLYPMTAYWLRTDKEFHPQRDLTLGLQLNFHPRVSADKLFALPDWLKRKHGKEFARNSGRFGGIPMGKIYGESLRDAIDKIRDCPIVTGVELVYPLARSETVSAVAANLGS